MKGKDLAFLAGGALLVYMLIPKEKVQAAAPGVSILGIPTPGEAPLDIGGIFGGMAGMFSSLLGAMPAQIIPEINIPEFTIPDWSKFIPEIPDWGQYIPEWGELLPDWDKLIDPLNIFDGNGGNGGNGEKGLIPSIKDLIIRNIAEPVTQVTGEAIAAPIAAAGEGATWFIDYIMHPFSLEYGVLAPLFKKKEMPEALVKESEAIFEAAGVTEVESMADIKALQAARAGIGQPTTYRGSELEQEDISLLMQHPYFGQFYK